MIAQVARQTRTSVGLKIVSFLSTANLHSPKAVRLCAGGWIPQFFRTILTTLAIFLNLLCLDAPLVAVAWQWLLASSAYANSSAASRLALFLTAWLIYLIDRVADSLYLSADAPKSA